VSHEPFETQAAVYALGALDGEERADFEAHLAGGCALCAEAVREHAETLADAARLGTPMIPPAHVKADLMRRVAVGAGGRPSPRRRRLLRWTVASAAAVIAVSGFVAGFVATRYEARIGFMARETTRVRADLHRQEAELRDRLALAQGVIDLLRDPATRVIALQGSGTGAGAWARLVWNDAGGGFLLTANLPATPADKAYELWTIAGGKPAPAGVFTVDASGRATHAVAAARAPVDVFAVTLEPAGGVPAPTGPIVLASAK
jgi:anti-sigma-K factor RskA